MCAVIACMVTLPHCDDLFLRYFDRWYDDDDRSRKGFAATRPDVLKADSLVGVSPPDASPLSGESQRDVLHRIETMLEAARGDWPSYLRISGHVDLSWITAFDGYYDPDRIEEVIARSDPADFSNDYIVLCCEFGAVLGHVMRCLQPRLVWYCEWPYWESALLDPPTGSLMPVFHWVVKKMSGYGWDDGFAEKVEACLQLSGRECEG
jgi:hypothetical protein